MPEPVVIKNVLVIESTAGKYWEIDRQAGTTTLYANAAAYPSSPVGTIQTQEIREVYEFIRNMDSQ